MSAGGGLADHSEQAARQDSAGRIPAPGALSSILLPRAEGHTAYEHRARGAVLGCLTFLRASLMTSFSTPAPRFLYDFSTPLCGGLRLHSTQAARILQSVVGKARSSDATRMFLGSRMSACSARVRGQSGSDSRGGRLHENPQDKAPCDRCYNCYRDCAQRNASELAALLKV